jgi:sulfonate transport system substrate-binding protein
VILTGLVFVAVLLLTLLSLTSRAKAGTAVFRIGYQKAANTLVLLKAHGTLEKRLQPLGVAVSLKGKAMLFGILAGAGVFHYDEPEAQARPLTQR